jgi:predicted dehydrogenase
LSGASPNEKLNIALVGVGGQGGSNLNQVASQNIVALCDVDQRRAGNAFTRFPAARQYRDFRRMFDELANRIDAVVVSTPDHTHFHPSMIALQLGKHLYCEKPMAHTVWEIRQMTELAAKMGVATQLGVQRHTLENVHRVVEWIQAGAIGKVTECHCWIDGDRGMPDVPPEQPVPDYVDWDLWLGPAPPRSFSSTICPYGWRFWWDYGTGETGNWGCHILDIPFWALGLKYPSRVEASGPPVDPARTPKSMSVKYEFRQTAEQPAVDLYWYHAAQGPPILRERGLPHEGHNTLFVGSQGMLLCGFGRRRLYPEAKFADWQPPPHAIADSPGFHQEWFAACKGGPAATCDFRYSGPLSETVILGNVAYRAQGGFDWSAAELRTSGNSAAEERLRPSFRRGWELATN